MKKLLLSVALSLGVLSSAPVMAATPAFSASQMAQVKIKDLSFKEVMRQFYKGQMKPSSINDAYIESLPNIGLGQVDANGIRIVALMHPVSLYENIKGEPRYLVTIEKVVVYDDSSEYCESCGSQADLYSFKRLNNGQFQLVSRTSENVVFYDRWGTMNLQDNEIQKTLQPLGESLVGSIFMSGYMAQGITDSSWAVLHLPEDEFINVYTLGDAGSDNSGQEEEDSPLYYDYEGVVKVMPINSKYYPIMLTYKGIPPDDLELPKFINKSFVMKFNPVKKVYETISSFAAL